MVTEAPSRDQVDQRRARSHERLQNTRRTRVGLPWAPSSGQRVQRRNQEDQRRARGPGEGYGPEKAKILSTSK